MGLSEHEAQVSKLHPWCLLKVTALRLQAKVQDL